MVPFPYPHSQPWWAGSTSQVSTAALPRFLSGVWLLRSVPSLPYGKRATQRIAPPRPSRKQQRDQSRSIQ